MPMKMSCRVYVSVLNCSLTASVPFIIVLIIIVFYFFIFFRICCNFFQIEGTFQINTPKHLLGYERIISNSESSHYRNSTFLSLFIMAQPPLHPPEPIKVDDSVFIT